MIRNAVMSILLSAVALAQYSTPTRDIDNPARQPWSCQVRHEPSNSVECPVPAGKRLVIEYVSGYFSVLNEYSPQEQVLVTHIFLYATTGGVSTEYMIPTRPDLLFRGGSTASEMVRVYADGGSKVRLSLNIPGTYTHLLVRGTVSGHLVNLP